MRSKTDLFLSPHNDDETLFGAYAILRYKPHVVVCLKSRIQELRGTGIAASQREYETARALWWLGDPTWEQWQFSDVDPDWDGFKAKLAEFDRTHPEIERVFAPETERDGHEHHSWVGSIAAVMFEDRYVPYLTYRRGYGRSVGTEVEFEPDWPAKKLRALSCYESQIAEPSTAYWFLDSGLREYVP